MDDKKNKKLLTTKPKKNAKAPSTQKFVEISEIKEDTVILKDGTLRAIILVSSINFSLKSEDEQNAIIAAYVNFLNVIDFPLQILIQSRKLDIDGYILRLKNKEKEQTNELLKIQTADYIEYIQQLVELGNIMTKRFYIVIPYNPTSDKQKNFFKRFLELFKTAQFITLSQDRFQKRKKELIQRVDHVMESLGSIGLKSVLLDTQSLIELYYNTYNPDVSQKQKLTDLNKLNIEWE